MADQFDEASSAQQRADVAVRFFTGTPASKRPTLPVPETPAARPRVGEAPRAAGRVALVYEEQVRRPWRLWVFTAVLVSLTVGVVLGQAEAYRPPSPRSASAAQVGGGPVPPPSAAVLTSPPAAPLTAPLGSVEERRLEIVGAATTLRVRTADLGESLLNVTALDQSAVVQLTDGEDGSLLALASGAAGTVGAEVLLNTKVAWTLKLAGGATELDVDARAGGLVGVELAADVSRGVLQLPKPEGRVPIAVSGPVSELTVRTEAGAPVRVRLARGAGLATINGRSQRGVKAGARLRETGWPAAESKYDVRVTADVSTIVIERLAPGA